MLSPKVFVFAMTILFLTALAFLAGLYFLLNPSVQKKPLLLNTSPVTSKPLGLTLKLSNPDDNLLVFDNDLLVQGQSSKDALVILSTDSDDQIMKTNKDGEFSTTLELEEGVNQLMVAAFDNSGNSKIETRIVYYSEEEI